MNYSRIPNYVRKQVTILPPLYPGEEIHMHAAHDHWCAHFEGRQCDCDPDVRLCWRSSNPNTRCEMCGRTSGRL